MSHYRQGRKIGTGGMASVYEGFDGKLGRPVAIKVPAEAVRDDPERRELFLAEARKMARVSHPNVVTVHDVEEDPPRIILELVDGGSLLPVSERGPTPPGTVVAILRQCLRGLRAIHDQGIVHRDLKPENVLRKREASGDVYKICDFGIAKLAHERTAPFRTEKYTAPECLLGRPAEAASDVYSLGLVAYELLLGAEGFHRVVRDLWSRCGASAGEVPWLEVESGADATVPWQLWQLEAVDLVPPHEVDPAIPPEVSRVVWGMVRKRRDERTPDGATALAALDAAAARPAEVAPARSGPGTGADPPLPGSAATSRQDGGAGTPADREPAPGTAVEETALEETALEDVTLEGTAVEDRPVAGPRGGRWTPWAAAALVVAVAALAAGTFRPAAGPGPAGHRERGLSRWVAGDFPGAIEALEVVVREAPGDVEAALTLAKARYKTGGYDRARALLEDLLEARPRDPEVALYLGLSEFSQGRTRAAIAHLGRAVETAEGRFPEAGFFLGYAHYKEGEAPRARARLEEYLAASSGDRELEGRARALLDILDRREAAGGGREPAGRPIYGRGLRLRGFRQPPVDLDAFRGSVVVLHFWASWCEPCHEEMPSLLEFHRRGYPELEERGLALLAVSNDYRQAELARFVDEVVGDVSGGPEIYWDPDWRLNDSLGLGGALPQTVIVGRDGRVLRRLRRTLDWQDPALLAELRAWLAAG